VREPSTTSAWGLAGRPAGGVAGIALIAAGANPDALSSTVFWFPIRVLSRGPAECCSRLPPWARAFTVDEDPRPPWASASCCRRSSSICAPSLDAFADADTRTHTGRPLEAQTQVGKMFPTERAVARYSYVARSRSFGRELGIPFARFRLGSAVDRGAALRPGPTASGNGRSSSGAVPDRQARAITWLDPLRASALWQQTATRPVAAAAPAILPPLPTPTPTVVVTSPAAPGGFGQDFVWRRPRSAVPGHGRSHSS